VAPAALATPATADPYPADYVPPPVVHTVVGGGMPGWQIALIVAGAAMLVGVVAVLADRAWAARRQATALAALGHDHPARQDLHLQGRS